MGAGEVFRRTTAVVNLISHSLHMVHQVVDVSVGDGVCGVDRR